MRLLAGSDQAVALVDGATGRTWTYGRLDEEVEDRASALRSSGERLVAVQATRSFETIATILAVMSAESAVLLLDESWPEEQRQALVERYRPDRVVGHDTDLEGYHRSGDAVGGLASGDVTELDPDTRLLLATSGSTGNPKLVRLPARAVVANATSIAEALRLDADHVAPTGLPLAYSFGFSILSSHLVSGATVCVTSDSVMERSFWSTLEERGCTSFSGVPYTYAMLERLRIDPSEVASVRALTQAGGRLPPERAMRFAEAARHHGADFFIMYGQTEATARMSVLPPEEFFDHPESAGRAVPRGVFDIEETDAGGEVVYHGPNVMYGYAESPTDLALGDVCQETLRTGDLGRLEDGLLYITGRVKRIAKVFGVRVNLDDVERQSSVFGHAVALSSDGGIVVVHEPNFDRAAAKSALPGLLGLHRSGFKFTEIDELPLNANGKPDYAAVSRFLG